MYFMEMNEAFLGYASDVLGETNKGLSGMKIVEYSNRFAVDFNRVIVHSTYPSMKQIAKRKILKDNLSCFDLKEQVQIINFLCDLSEMKDKEEVKDLKAKLISQYGEYLELEEIDNELITETRTWLSKYPDALKVYESGLQKHQMGQFERNVLDDMRLSMELLVKNILGNQRSLENNIGDLGTYLKDKGVSTELRNLFSQIINVYTKYQNEHVKHDDKINGIEKEFIIEQTSILMKLMMKVA